MGSTRALACPDRRLAGRIGVPMRQLNGDSCEHPNGVGEGADPGTRGRMRSPSQLSSCGSVYGFLSYLVSYVVINFPAKILVQRFPQAGRNSSRIDGDVVFEAILANIGEQFLKLFDSDHSIAAERLEWIVG